MQGDIRAHLQDVRGIRYGWGLAAAVSQRIFAYQNAHRCESPGTRLEPQQATIKARAVGALLIDGQQVVTLSATQLLFDSSGKLQFKVDPKNVKLPGVLSFVSTYLSPFLQGGNGLSVQLQGTQVVALLNLPIPDVSGLTSGITNLSLSCKFGVGLVNGKFQLDVGFGLSDPLKPFNVAFFILGVRGSLPDATASSQCLPNVSRPLAGSISASWRALVLPSHSARFPEAYTRF